MKKSFKMFFFKKIFFKRYIWGLNPKNPPKNGKKLGYNFEPIGGPLFPGRAFRLGLIKGATKFPHRIVLINFN